MIVEWVAEEPVYEPIVEDVMVARGGTGMTTFVRCRRIIESFERDRIRSAGVLNQES